MASNTARLIHATKRANGGVVLHMDVARELCSVYQDGVVADDTVMGNVHIGHDEVMAADPSTIPALVRAVAYRRELAKLIGIAYFKPAPNARIGEIPRATDRAMQIEMVLPANSRRSRQDSIIFDNAVVAKLNSITDTIA